MKKDTGPYYAIFLNISGRQCVVIGGGKVALRKVLGLLEHHALVKVISPILCDELKELGKAGNIQIFQKVYQPGDLDGTLVAIAATNDPSVNTAVAKEGLEKKILVNVVDEPAISTFVLPACLQRGDLNIAISTSGKSPALARKLRTRLETEFGEEYAALVRIANEARSEAKRQGIQANGDAWQEALDIERLIKLVKQGEFEKAREVILAGLQTKKV